MPPRKRCHCHEQKAEGHAGLWRNGCAVSCTGGPKGVEGPSPKQQRQHARLSLGGGGGMGGHRIGWAHVLEQKELRRYPHPRPTSSPPPPPFPSHLQRLRHRCSVRPSGSCPGGEWADHIEWYVSMEMDCPEVIRFYGGHGFCHKLIALGLLCPVTFVDNEEGQGGP